MWIPHLNNIMKKLIISIVFCISVLTFTVSANVEGGSAMEILSEQYQISPIFEDDFNSYSEATPLDGMWVVSPNSASPAVISAENETSLAVAVGPAPIGNSEAYINMPQTLRGVVAIKCNYYFSENDTHRKLIFTSLDSNYKNENYFLWANKNGKIERQPNAEFLIDYLPNTWYEIVAVIDIDNYKYELYINGDKVIDKRDTPNTAFDGLKRIYFVKQWDNVLGLNTTYMDNVGVYSLKEYPHAVFQKALKDEQEYNSADAIPFDTDMISVNFTQAITSSSVAGRIRLTQSGNPVETEGVLSEDGMRYDIIIKELLDADAEYSIVFSEGIKSKNEIALVTESIELKTAKNVVSKIDLSHSGSVLKGTLVQAYANAVYLESAPTNDVLLMLVLYKDRKFIDVAYFKEQITQDKQISLSIQVPNDEGDYIVKAFSWDNLQDMNAYTK